LAELTGLAEERVEIREVVEAGTGVAPRVSADDAQSEVSIDAQLHFPAGTPPAALKAWAASLEGAYFAQLAEMGVLVTSLTADEDMGNSVTTAGECVVGCL
jgi:hypothetical protein